MVIDAFNKLSLPLLVVGNGSEEKKLKKRAGSTIRFSGFVPDSELAELYHGARAVIFPSEEDFGMVAVEALSFGVPVIGLEYGGLREIVTSGVTGEFFHTATPEIIAEAVRRFLEKETVYSKTAARQSVVQFTEKRFRESMGAVIEKV